MSIGPRHDEPADIRGVTAGARLPLGLGADVLRVEYAYHLREDLWALTDDEKDRWFHADVTAAGRAGLAQRAYQQVTLVGKARDAGLSRRGPMTAWR